MGLARDQSCDAAKSYFVPQISLSLSNISNVAKNAELRSC